MTDIGPVAVHERVTEDTRDMRDPSVLGGVLLNVRGSTDICRFADEVDNGMVTEIPNYDKNESMQKVAQAEVEADYKRRAEEGDRFAQIALDGEAWDEPVD